MNKKELSIINSAFDLKPVEAIAFLKKKGFKFTWDWREQIRMNHERAFTIAKAMKMDVLQDVKDSLQQALDKGETFEAFQFKLAPKLKAKGWWGRQEVMGPMGKQEVQLGSPHRLQTIYRTNSQTAFMKGRMEFFKSNQADRPYLQYVAVIDDNTRPEHAALDGVIKPIDDPFWDTHTPPLPSSPWSCRCNVRALTVEQVQERGGVDEKDYPSDEPAGEWEPQEADYSPEIWELGREDNDE